MLLLLLLLLDCIDEVLCREEDWDGSYEVDQPRRIRRKTQNAATRRPLSFVRDRTSYSRPLPRTPVVSLVRLMEYSPDAHNDAPHGSTLYTPVAMSIRAVRTSRDNHHLTGHRPTPSAL